MYLLIYTIAENHLQKERNVLIQKIANMQEEVLLLDEHLRNQNGKIKDIDSSIETYTNEIILLHNTLESINKDIEKAQIIVSSTSVR
jgi:hypothetical protein